MPLSAQSGQYPAQAQPQPQFVPQQTSGLAIGSLIASVVGLVICLFVGQIIGIILGHMARKEIRESGGRLGGEGLATAGIIVGWVGIGFDVLVVICYGFVFAAGIAGGL